MEPDNKKIRFASVWDAIADTPSEAAYLKLASHLMMHLQQHIKQQGWTRDEAARHCHLTRPRLDELIAGKLGLFTFEALINIATALDLAIDLTVSPSVKNRAHVAPVDRTAC